MDNRKRKFESYLDTEIYNKNKIIKKNPIINDDYNCYNYYLLFITIIISFSIYYSYF